MGHNSSRLGQQGTWKRSTQCTPRELYNTQQDTWALFVIISLREDAGNKVDLSLSPEEASKEISYYHKRGCAVQVFLMDEDGTSYEAKIPKLLQRFTNLLGMPLPEKHRLLHCAGGFQAYRTEYPFMCSGHPHYEEGRLYPSHVQQDRPLYISSLSLATSPEVISALGITHIVNVTAHDPCTFEKQGRQAHDTAPSQVRTALRRVEYLRVPVLDSADQSIAEYFAIANDFIDKGLSMGGAVLVHCKHGQSRSATILAAYLMHCDNTLTVADALAELKACRSRVSPNCGFLKQLGDLQCGIAKADSNDN